MEKRIYKLCKKLSLRGYKELREMGINAQQVMKIKQGALPNFRLKTLERLEKEVK